MNGTQGQDDLYRRVAEEYGAALERLAYAYEADADRRSDLLQEIHLELWRSFEKFSGRCSLRTWIYRVAHNAATSYAIRQSRRNAAAFVTLEEADAQDGQENVEVFADRQKLLARLLHPAARARRSPTDAGLPGRYERGIDS